MTERHPGEATSLCECTLMTCSSGEATSYLLATNHHPSCPKGWPRDALQVIVALGKSVGANPVSSGAWEVYQTACKALQATTDAKG